MREERGKEYCKLLLPLVSCSERWVVCLLPRRTRYCATYLRTHPRQKSSSTSSLSFPFVLFFLRLPLRRGIVVAARDRQSPFFLAVQSRSGTSKEVRSGKKRATRTAVAPRNARKSKSLLFYFAIRFFFFPAIRPRLLIV